MAQPDREQLDHMRRAIAALPEVTREIYRLHLFDGLDFAEIAGRLGIECNDVERHVAEAIVLIDRALRDADLSG